MNVVLVKPKIENIHPSKGTIRSPVGLTYVAAACEKAGHRVVIVDSEVLDLSGDALTDAILSHAPGIVGVTATSPVIATAARISRAIHARDARLPTIIGGPHASAIPRETLEATDFDYACAGEGEAVMPPLLERLDRKAEPSGIPGLLYRAGHEIRGDPHQALVDDLDALAFPARHLLSMTSYMDLPRGIVEPQDTLVTTRGCVGKCAFCASAGTKPRFRSLDNLLAELDEIVNKHHIRYLIIGDDTFTLSKKRIVDFCKEIVARRYDLHYLCQTRLDTIDAEILEWLSKSGCYAICFGVESGTPRVLESMGKRLSIDRMLQNLPLVKASGITIRTTYIIGWIDETEEEVWNTINLAKKVDADETAFCIATPFPGTRLWDEAVRRGMRVDLKKMENFHFYFDVGFNVSKILTPRLLELQKTAHEMQPSRVYKVCA